MRRSARLLFALAILLPSAAWAEGDPNADADGDGQRKFLDCDDNDPARGLNFEEICDGQDNDCHDDTDEALDGDGDGQTICDGDCDDTDGDISTADGDGDGLSGCSGDCDDTDPLINPFDVDGDGLSTCDPLADCDDEDPAANWNDEDEDGASTCDEEADCDDANPLLAPGLEELCTDSLDNDCSGIVNDLDADSDGAISPDCGGDDCNDASAAIDPNTPETGQSCSDLIDNDCDGVIDDADEDCFVPPDPDAGDDSHELFLGGTILVALDASGSVDDNFGDVLTYAWTLDTDLSDYPGVTAEIVQTDPTQAVSFLRFHAEPDTELTQWVFDLHVVVDDGNEATDPDADEAQVQVTISRPTFYSQLKGCSAAGGAAGLPGLMLLVGARRRRR